MGDNGAKAFLVVILSDLVMSFNVGKTMNQNQIVDLVNFIQQDYYFLKPSELKYCFDNAKKGKYGQLFDRIDSAIICQWIETYLDERIGVCVSENQKKNLEFNSIRVHEDILKALKNVVEKPIIKDGATIIESDEQREFSNKIFKEFDKIHEENPVGEDRGKKFINYNGKIVDINEFLEIKFKENAK